MVFSFVNPRVAEAANPGLRGATALRLRNRAKLRLASCLSFFSPRQRESFMKTFVVGDIHGRCAQLSGLLDLLPRDEATDTLVFLGDLIDRGPDIPGCVEHVFKLCQENPERVICLRGNHEQMLLDFIDGENTIWIDPSTGSDQTFAQFAGERLDLQVDA